MERSLVHAAFHNRIVLTFLFGGMSHLCSDRLHGSLACSQLSEDKRRVGLLLCFYVPNEHMFTCFWVSKDVQHLCTLTRIQHSALGASVELVKPGSEHKPNMSSRLFFPNVSVFHSIFDSFRAFIDCFAREQQVAGTVLLGVYVRPFVRPSEVRHSTIAL